MRLPLILAGIEVGFVDMTRDGAGYVSRTAARLTPDGNVLRVTAGGVNLGILVDSADGKSMTASRRLNASEYEAASESGKAGVSPASAPVVAPPGVREERTEQAEQSSDNARLDADEAARGDKASSVVAWRRVTEIPDWIPRWLAPDFEDAEYAYVSDEPESIACPFARDKPFPLVAAMGAVRLGVVNGERCGIADRTGLCR